MMHRTPARASVLLVMLVAFACTGERRTAPTDAGADVRLSGSVLARMQAGTTLVIIDPDDGSERPVRMPAGTVLAHRASFAPDGSIVAVVEAPYGRPGVYRLGIDQDPRPLGPPLHGTFTFDIEANSVLAAGCDRPGIGFVLDLEAPSTWRRVDAACGAALSPDGRSVATPVDGNSVRVVAIDGTAAPATVLSLDELARGSLSDGARITGQIAWDDQGMAFTVGSADVESLVVVLDAGTATIEPLGAHAEWIETMLVWQPGGSLLAAAGATRLEGLVRIADPRSGDVRVVAILREPPSGIAWAPDGRVLLASTLGRWTFLGPDGAWLRVLPYSRGRAMPMDWRA